MVGKCIQVISLTLLFFTIYTISFSQKKKKPIEVTKADTVFVFSQIRDENVSENNIYWPAKNEMTLLFTQMIREPDWDGGQVLYFSVVFDHWDSVRVEQTFDLHDLFSDCEIERVFGGDRFEKPAGTIIFQGWQDKKMVFRFNVQALSTDKNKLLVFQGLREFGPDP